MSKRPALEPLEEMYDAPSPAPKRAKVEDEEMESPQPDGATSNGHLMSPREQYRDKVDITGAYDEEHAELLDEEVGAALLTMERKSFANDGSVVEFGYHVYRASRYSFEVTLVDS